MHLSEFHITIAVLVEQNVHEYRYKFCVKCLDLS